jgi:cytochrome c biogenesis protein CcmG, thiol:disulfide interchange protein DsbE
MRLPNVIVTAVALLLASMLAWPAITGEGINARAPDFTLKKVTGENYSLEQNLGKGPIVLNFWATWCGPCILEMKNLKKTYARYAAAGLQMLSISIDDNKTQPQIPSIVRTYKFPYTILLDENKDVYKAYHVANVPQIFIIDAQGNIVYNHQGYQKGDEKKVEAIVAKLIGDKK